MAEWAYVSDLDGTLLRSDATLSPRSLELLSQQLDAGLVFTVATARGVQTVQPILRGLRLRLPIVTFNGSYITDLETGRHELVRALEPELAAEAFALLSRDGHEPLVSAHGGEDLLFYTPPRNAGAARYLDLRKAAHDGRLRPVRSSREGLHAQVVCLTVIDRREALEPLAERVREQLGTSVQLNVFEDMYDLPWHWLTIHHELATKACALRELAGRLERELSELTVFGDQHNDLSMFEVAGRGVAVENAVPELKALATHLIGKNDDDSVSRFIAEERG